MNEYPNSGKLANNRFKDNDKKPDMKGEISMQRSVLKQLMEEHDGDEIVIKLSAWRRQGNYGEFFSVKWDNYKKAEERPYSKPAAPADDSDVPF